MEIEPTNLSHLFSSWWSHYTLVTCRPCGAQLIRVVNQPIRKSWPWTSWLRSPTLLTSRTSIAFLMYVVALVLKQIPKQNSMNFMSTCTQRSLQVLLPYLAAKASSASSVLIRTLAHELKANKREILISNFKYIFSHLVCSCTKEELEKAFHYLQVLICSRSEDHILI